MGMRKQKNKDIKVTLRPTAAKVAQIIDKLDAETPDDANVNYKRLYYRAVNGLTELLEHFGYPGVSNPVLERIAELQQELEDQFMND